MKIAAFFNDAKSNPPGAQQAARLVLHFLANFQYESCNTDELLMLAELAMRARREDVARKSLLVALARSGKIHVVHYRLGRLDAADDDYGAASGHFAAGIAANPDFPYNWMGQARALLALGRADQAMEFAERFVRFGVRPHAREEIGQLAQIADMLFMRGERERAAPIYALLETFGDSGPTILVRHAESLMEQGKHAEAVVLLRRAEAAGELDAWGCRALAECESLAGAHASAARYAETALAERPEDAGFLCTYFEIVARDTAPDRWRSAALRMGDRKFPEVALELLARHHLEEGDIAAAAKFLESAPLIPRSRPFWLAIHIAYAALAAGDTTRATDLAERLEAEAGPEELAPVLLRTNLLIHEQLWEEADAVLARLPASRALVPEIKLKKFELACFTGRLTEAATLFAEIDAANNLPRQAMLPIFRYLAEQQDFAELVRRAALWIGTDFRFSQIGEVFFRAARHTGRHAELLDAIASLTNWHQNADLVRLHTALAWDSATTLEQMERAAAAASENPITCRRMEMHRQTLIRATTLPPPPTRNALFLCGNAAYLWASFVALHSALDHASPEKTDIFLCVDTGIAGLARRLTKPFLSRGFSIEVVEADAVIADMRMLSPAYGLFTSGHLLAASAYYRIYFARHLQEGGKYVRALYIDSDVLVLKNLDALFSIDLGQHPLAARPEIPRPEVARATSLHKLQPGTYFNSGVLLFDLLSERLLPCLNAAIAAVADPHVKKLFHDQCALNLGFRDAYRPLDPSWNTLVVENTPLCDVPENVGILHYLDRPKPWSICYEGPCASLWLDQWSKCEALLGAPSALSLIAAS